MWELLVNGLSLVGTGHSFISGFTLDKKVKELRSSQERLEKIQSQLLERVNSTNVLGNDILPLLDSFRRESNPGEQLKISQILGEYSRQLQGDLQGKTYSLLTDAVSEMQRTLESVRLTLAPAQPAPPQFLNTLFRDPFAAGLVEFKDISTGGIWGVNESHLVNPHMSPVSWVNPFTGRSFLGRITLGDLQRYGINVTPPRYRHTVGGHVYSEVHGLYLPAYMVSYG